MGESLDDFMNEVTLGETLRKLASELHDVHETGEETLIAVKALSKRVDRLWDAVFGVRLDDHTVPGLVQQMGIVVPVIKTIQKGISVLKGATVTFVGALLVGLANLLIIITY